MRRQKGRIATVGRVIASAVIDNLASAPVIAFVVAVVATLLRADIRLPDGLYPVLSSYLLLAIGIKGGRGLGAADLGDVWAPLVASGVLGVITPIVAYVLMRQAGRLSRIDAAAVAAHYGSVSAVTFTVVIALLDAQAQPYEQFLPGLLAVLEVVGIVVALALVRNGSEGGWRTGISEVVRGRSITLLLGGLVIGLVVGSERLVAVDPLFVGLFTGALTLFLIEMGVVAAERFRDALSVGWRIVALAVVIPLVNGSLGAVAGSLVGLSTGGTAVLATLAASASYIAAPAAVRLALPSASPGIYVTTSLGITFPFNVIVGIPLYVAMAEVLT
jgi:uncharacterized protein